MNGRQEQSATARSRAQGVNPRDTQRNVIRDLQRAIGNQSVQRLMRSGNLTKFDNNLSRDKDNNSGIQAGSASPEAGLTLESKAPPPLHTAATVTGGLEKTTAVEKAAITSTMTPTPGPSITPSTKPAAATAIVPPEAPLAAAPSAKAATSATATEAEAAIEDVIPSEEEAAMPEKEELEKAKKKGGEEEAAEKEADKLKPEGEEAAAAEEQAGKPIEQMQKESEAKEKEKKSPASPDEDPAFKAVLKKVARVAKQQGHNNPAKRRAAEAQAAAKGPPNEVASQAAGAQVAKMDAQEPQAFDRAAFKAALLAKIASITPKTQKDADEFKETNKAGTIKTEVISGVSEGKETAQGPIKQTAEQPPDPSVAQPKPVTDLAPPDAGPPPPDVGAEAAIPKPKTASEVSLQEGSQSLEQQMTDADVTEEQLQNSNEPEFQGALAQKNEAQTHAEEAPMAYRQDEQAILAGAQTEVVGGTQQQLQAMHATRGSQFNQIGGDQVATKSVDEQKRAEVATHIEGIYQKTKSDVEARLTKLDSEVNTIFDKGAEQARKEFEDFVDRRMTDYKIDRYLSIPVVGQARWLKDKFAGLPDEVNVFYVQGRDLYISRMDAVIDQVATAVEIGLNEAKGIIAAGRQEVQEYVASLPEDLKQVGQEAADKIQSKFDELRQNVDQKQDQLVDSLAQKYVDNLNKVDERINQMKEENRGLVDKAIDAIGSAIKTILELKNMLMGVLSRAAAAIGKIIKDPIGFVQNLVSGVKAGLDRFVANIGTHLQKGLMGWLLGTLAEAGIQVPETFDLKGILGLVMQVLGLTYPNIRKRAVSIIGEGIVSKLEQAAEIFKILITQGPSGLWEYIKDKIGDLKATVIDGIKSFVIESVVVAGITWIVSLLNPASAFIKAAKAIYDIIMFFVNNGSQIISLVNAVIDSVSAIADGNIGVAAAAVENALGKAISPAISFLASLLGLGGISEKIRKIIEKIQGPINTAIDWVIQKAVELVKAAGKLFGIGKEEEKPEEEDPEKALKVEAGLAAIDQLEQRYVKEGKISREKAEEIADKVKHEHPVFTAISVVDGGETWDYKYAASAPKPKKGEKKELLVEEGAEIKVSGQGKWPLAKVTKVVASIHILFEGDGIKGQLSFEGYGKVWKLYDPEAGYKTGSDWDAIKGLSEWPDFDDARQALNYRYHGKFSNPIGKQWHHIYERSAGGPHSVTNLAITSSSNNQAFNIWYMQAQPGTGGVPLRDWLKGAPAAIHVEWGQRCIRAHGLSITTHSSPIGEYQSIP